MPSRFNEHPLRRALAAEVYARPFTRLQAPVRASHLALFTGEGGAEADRAHLADLCARFHAPVPAADSNFLLADLGDLQVRWERHTEFVTYTFFAAERAPRSGGGAAERFRDTVIERVPRDWLETIPGEVIASLHLELEPSADETLAHEDVPRVMAAEHFAGGRVGGGAAEAWINFAIGEDGFGRVLVRDDRLGARQAGRLVQRLFEIETYRMMALLALPLARLHAPALARLSGRLEQLTQELTRCEGLDSERELLGELTALSAEMERIAAGTADRFGAARAYWALVERRIGELREERVEGFQSIAELMDRRMSPAMRTCESVAERLDRLSARVTSAGQLLRARVDIQVEAQNRNLLASMDRRAHLQLRLQETVEGLSVAAITYYGVGLVAYAAKALDKLALLPVAVETATGIAIPVIALLVWGGVRRVRHSITRDIG